MRICSLLPSATEIVAELGLVGSLVGISEECDWPPEVRGLPVVTASRVETTRLTSLEIDRAAREAVGDGRPLYAIDRALLETLEPDLIRPMSMDPPLLVGSQEVGLGDPAVAYHVNGCEHQWEYRLVSASCSDLQLVAASIRGSCSQFQVFAAGRNHSARTFNPRSRDGDVSYATSR
jgi:hypothetical protein